MSDHSRHLVLKSNTSYLASNLLSSKARPHSLNHLLLRSLLPLISRMGNRPLKDNLLLLAGSPSSSCAGAHHSYSGLRLLLVLLLPGSGISHHRVLLKLLFQVRRQIGCNAHSRVGCACNGERLLRRVQLQSGCRFCWLIRLRLNTFRRSG